MTPIEQELALIAEQFPGEFQRLASVIQEGKIDGSCLAKPAIPCGCFYGWLCYLDLEQATQVTKQMRTRLRNNAYEETPIEDLLYTTRPGDTPDTDETLKHLLSFMQPYLC